MIPSGRDLASLKSIQQDLAEFNKITLKLQDSTITMLDVRMIFDEIISSYPSMRHQLAEDAQIVKVPLFESAICKVIAREQENLEGMEVAIDCIKEAFAIQDQKSNANLYQIFEVNTNTIKNNTSSNKNNISNNKNNISNNKNNIRSNWEKQFFLLLL